MKKIFIALTLFATVSFGAFAGPRKGRMNPDFNRVPMKELNLTEEQKAKVESVNKDFRAKAEALRNDSSLTKEKRSEQRRELAKNRQTELQALLTPEQQSKMKELKEKRMQRNDRNDRASKQRNQRRMSQKQRNPMQKLNLSAEQQEKIQAINKDYRTKQDALNKSKFDDIKSVLTPEQQLMLDASKKQSMDKKHFSSRGKGGKRSPQQAPNEKETK
ncbi:hypothetical protein [Dysgonomonas macrotermitis]|uniref:LTXXQ motif family protein n=1 Tax=Dysgonomonas macrotermitis TaxID=1346286 RepID=A0A1M5F552_9BACT|nr:hypothetical protein [Dysgonomonas macrotermitis]SHF86694.1 hypothetical protein SAMN05444362_11157 [Dysgonomonas macrotermitis]